MANRKPTQAQQVLRYMETFEYITQFEAMNALGIMRLASRISELKRNGYNIESKTIPVKNRFGKVCHVKQYTLGGEENGN